MNRSTRWRPDWSKEITDLLVSLQPAGERREEKLQWPRLLDLFRYFVPSLLCESWGTCWCTLQRPLSLEITLPRNARIPAAEGICTHSPACMSPPQTVGHCLSGEGAAWRRGSQGLWTCPRRSILSWGDPLPPQSSSPTFWPTVDTPQTCIKCMKTES